MINLKVILISLCVFINSTVFALNKHKHSIGYQNNNSNLMWSRSESMDANGIFILDWKISEKFIKFCVTVNTHGFIGLGFSQYTDDTQKIDFLITWIDDVTGNAVILDYNGYQKQSTINHNQNQFPLEAFKSLVKDDTQNYQIISGHKNLTHTIIEFERSLETCDPHDIEINSDTMKVLWAYSDSNPKINDFKIDLEQFTKYGIKMLHLLLPLTRKPSNALDGHGGKLLNQFDFVVNNTRIDTTMETLYWCKILRLPSQINSMKHIIGYEPLLTLDPKIKRPIVHHMTLFECSVTTNYDLNDSDKTEWDVWSQGTGTECNSISLTPSNWDACVTPIATWSIGSSGQFLPEHIGIEMGGEHKTKYYMLELHYDNLYRKNFLDNSGFRIHYTSELRLNNAGILMTGLSILDTHIIPPEQQLYRNIGVCGPSCTGSLFPVNGINIVSVILHSHTAGRLMKLRHIRNGIELNRIVEDNQFNYDYQQFRQLDNETTVLPGDYLLTDCTYETIGRKHLTFGGYSTRQEMCLSLILYYPKIDLVGCYSMTPVKEFFESLGVKSFYGKNMIDIENHILSKGFDTNSQTSNLTIMVTHESNSDDDDTNLYTTETLKYLRKYSLSDEENLSERESYLNKLIIADAGEFHGLTFMEHLNQLPWSEQSFTRKVEHTFLNGKHMTFCRVLNTSKIVPIEIINFPNFTNYVKPPGHCPFQHELLINVFNIGCSFTVRDIFDLLFLTIFLTIYNNYVR